LKNWTGKVFFLLILVKNAVKFKEFHQNLKSFFFVGDGENLGFHIFDLTYTCVEKYVTGKKFKPRPKFYKDLKI
jgi:hypothetical protein